jgi:hypothetical protein
MLHLVPAQDDDESFVRMISAVASNIVFSVQPNDCYILKLDNWFDHKWLLWPGQRPWAEGTVHEKTPLPCFTPARIVSQVHFLRTTDPPGYKHATDMKCIHDYDGWYPRKTHRWLSDFSDSGVFVWYSGNTAVNGRGSLMVYMNTDASNSAWYASFQKKRAWAVRACKPISRREVESLLTEVPA